MSSRVIWALSEWAQSLTAAGWALRHGGLHAVLLRRQLLVLRLAVARCRVLRHCQLLLGKQLLLLHMLRHQL